MISTVTLNPSLDKTLFVDRLRAEDVCRAREVFVDPGGKGINVASVLQALGARTMAYALVGGANGEALEQLLGSMGLPFLFVRGAGETRENLLIIEESSGLQFKINAPGPLALPKEIEDLKEKLFQTRPEKTKYLVLSGSLPQGLHPGTYRELIETAHDLGISTLLDSDEAPLTEGILARPTILKINRQELERFFNRKFEEGDVLKAARELVAQGVGTVVVSSGAFPAYAVDAFSAWRAFPPQVEAVCPVGAGDAMAAGLVFAISEGKALRDALVFGIAAGTSAAMSPGNRRIGREAVMRFLPLVKAERIN